MTAKPEHPASLIDSLQSEVSAEASPMILFLVKHAKKIVAGIVLFILAIGGYWIHASRTESRLAAEALELGRILTITDPAVRLKKLETFQPGAPESVTNQVWFAIAENARDLGKYDTLYAAWQALGKRNENLAVLSAMGMASALAAQGKDKEALASLDAVSANLNPFDTVLVLSRIAVLAESIDDYQRALAACDSLINSMGSQGGIGIDEAPLWIQKKGVLERKLAANAR